MAKQLKIKGKINVNVSSEAIDEVRKVQAARADNILVNLDKELALPMATKCYKLIAFHENQLFDKNTGLPYNPAFGSEDVVDVVPLPYVKAGHLNINHTKGVFTKTLLPKYIGVTPDNVSMTLQKFRVSDSTLYSALTNYYPDENQLKKFITEYKGYQLSEQNAYYIAAIEVVENKSSAPNFYEPIGSPKIVQLTRRWGTLAVAAIATEMSRLKRETMDDEGNVDEAALDALFGTVKPARGKLLNGIVVKFVNDPASDLFDGKTKKRIVTTVGNVKFQPTTPMEYEPINILGYLEKSRQPDQKVVDLLTDMFNLETEDCCFSADLKYKPEASYFSDVEIFTDKKDEKDAEGDNEDDDIEEQDDDM